jgi:soluble lytic murein transglycosylase
MIDAILSLTARLLLRGLAASFLMMAALPLAAKAADLDAQRKQFLDAYHAFQRNDVTRGRTLSHGLEGYVLYPYLRYEMLKRRLATLPAQEVREFINAGGGSYLGEQLRDDWLTLLAKHKRWSDYLADYQPQNDTALQCYELIARAHRDGMSPALLDSLKSLWQTGDSLPKECDPALALLAKSGAMNDELIWARLRLAIDEGHMSLAAYLSKKLSPAKRHWAVLWREMRAHPARTLNKPAFAADNAESRQILLYGISRLARRDADAALSRWQALSASHHFSDEEKGRSFARIAVAAAQQDADNALTLLDQVPRAYSDDRVQRAKLVACLEVGDWKRLKRWTEQPADPDMESESWRYWRARSLEETGDAAAAKAIYAKLSRERDYYGLVAAGRLGHSYKFQSEPITVPDDQLAAFNDRPGIRRAHEFLELGMKLQARREWYFSTRQLDRHGMALAAVTAYRWQWYDRAIIAAAHAREYGDLAIRFPVVYGDLINKYANKRDIEPAVMLSLIRAESAFTEDAYSPAGAMGLMQLMPATGRLTARKIGHPLKHVNRLMHAEDNIVLGSAYLQHVLEKFDGNLAMAAAAYNAGPHRVTRWQPKTSCMPTDMWVDTIPFTETRRYVRHIIFNTAIYETRLQAQEKTTPQRIAMVHAEKMRGSLECGVGLSSNDES